METAKDLIAEYSQSVKEGAGLNKETETLEKEKKKKEAEFYDKYSESERELLDKKSIEREAIGKVYDEKEAILKGKREKAYLPQAKLGRIIQFLNLSLCAEEFKQRDITKVIRPYRDNKPPEAVAEYSDDYLKLKLFVSESSYRSTVNRYELIALGTCLFQSDRDSKLLQYRHDYGLNISESGLGIARFIRKAKTAEGLREYVKKHQLEKIMADFFEQYNKVKAEYEQTIKDYKPDDFKGLLFVKVVDYYSVFGYHVSQKEIALKEMITYNKEDWKEY